MGGTVRDLAEDCPSAGESLGALPTVRVHPLLPEVEPE